MKYKQLRLNNDQRKLIEATMVKMHKIISPGEYGLGNEPGSFSHDDKRAWEELGVLYVKLERLLFPPEEV